MDTSQLALPKPSHKPQSKSRTCGWKEIDAVARAWDGKRFLANRNAWQWVRRVLCRLAEERCERCRRPTPLDEGQGHHIYGRGGGRRDDRPYILSYAGALIKNLEWLCWRCHGKEHNQ